MRNTRYILIVLLSIALSVRGQDDKKRTASYYFEKGEQSLAKKEYISAQAHFNECLRLDPYFTEAYRLRGMVREHLGENAKALTDYNVYVDLKPDDPEVLFSRAVLRFEAGQYLLARQDFLKLLKLPHGETNTVFFSKEKYSDINAEIFTANSRSKDYLYNYLGLIETRIKRFDHAISWLDSAIQLAPGNTTYWINRGTAKMDKNDKQGAAADFEQALKIDPDNSLAMHNLATLKAFAGETDSVEKLLDAAIEKNKNIPYPRAERAFMRFQKNDLKGALEDYNEVVRLEPKDEENYINRGLVKEKMKDLHGALNDFTTATTLNDRNEKSWLCRGNILSKLFRWKESLEDYTVAIHLQPEYKLAYYNRAIAFQSLGQKQEACADIKTAEKLGVIIEAKVRDRMCK